MKRATLTVFVLLLALTGIFCLAACNDGAETHTHTLVHRDAVAATCTSPGNEQYWECSECGKLFSDEAGTTEIASAATAPLGHDFADGVCTRCGEKDYDTQIGPLTRAEFEKALDIAALPNFTVTDKDPDGTVNFIYKFVTTEEYDVAYYSEPGAGEDYFFLQDKSTGVTTQYAYDRDESKWTSEPTKKTVASIKTGFVYADNSSLSMDVAGAYPTATFDGTKYILPDCYRYHTMGWERDVEVTFDSDKRLASLRTVIGDFSTPYYFSDYGTTEIVLPDFEAQATWGFVFSEDDLGLVTAYFNPDDPICGAYAPDRIYVPAEWNGKPVSVVNISSVYDSTYISLKGLDALERLAINYATSLDTLELPLITEEIFPYLDGVDALKTVTYPGTKAQWTAAGLDDAFDGYRGLTVEFGTHTFGEWQTEREADCENAGLMTRQCSDCGKVEEQIIPAKDTLSATGRPSLPSHAPRTGWTSASVRRVATKRKGRSRQADTPSAGGLFCPPRHAWTKARRAAPAPSAARKKSALSPQRAYTPTPRNGSPLPKRTGTSAPYAARLRTRARTSLRTGTNAPCAVTRAWNSPLTATGHHTY